jgi:hypothetical protein
MQLKICEFAGFQNGVIKESGLLGCDYASLGIFRRFEITYHIHLRDCFSFSDWFSSEITPQTKSNVTDNHTRSLNDSYNMTVLKTHIFDPSIYISGWRFVGISTTRPFTVRVLHEHYQRMI